MGHKNRSTRNPHPYRNPFPREIRAAREAAGLTQTQAAQLIGRSLRGWQAFEAEKADVLWRPMDPVLWEYWQFLVEENEAVASARFIKMRQARRQAIQS